MLGSPEEIVDSPNQIPEPSSDPVPVTPEDEQISGQDVDSLLPSNEELDKRLQQMDMELPDFDGSEEKGSHASGPQESVSPEYDVGEKRRKLDSIPQQQVGRAIFEARMSVSSSPIVGKLPWEKGVFKDIFGSNNLRIPEPKMEVAKPPEGTLPYLPTYDEARPVLLQDQEVPTYVHAVRLRAGWRSVGRSTDRDAILRRWRAVLFHDLLGSETGRKLSDLDSDEEQLQLLETIFSGRETSTLTKRVNSMIRYIVHCDKSEMVDSQVFPLNATTMFDYATFLQRSGKFSAIQSFMEAVTFCQHVVGVDMIGNVTTPWMRGITRDARMHRAAKKQSRLLTVSEIRALEKYVINGKGHPYDVHAAGCFLCLLYGRARVSDIRNVDACIVDIPDESDERHGYVEFSTFDYKKARVSKFTGTPFIVLVPVYGLEDASWGIHFIKNARQIGLDFEKGYRGAVLPRPAENGLLTGRTVTSTEVTDWLNKSLERLLGDVPSGLTSHGLKATLLSWCARAGMSEPDRHVPGGHTMSGKRSMACYSRDMLAAPVYRMEQVVKTVKLGTFCPDSSRSGLFRGEGRRLRFPDIIPTAVVGEDREEKSDEPGDIGETSFDGDRKCEDDLNSNATGTPTLVSEANTEAAEKPDNSDDGTSSSDSSSSSDSDIDEKAEGCVRRNSMMKKAPAVVWRRSCSVYIHKKSRVMHLAPDGSTASTFVCGRQIGGEYKPFSGTIFAESKKCRQCDSGRSIRDVSSALAFLDSRREKE